VQVIDQRAVARVDRKLDVSDVAQGGEVILAGEGLAGIQHADGRGARHFGEQTEHGAAAAALAGDDVVVATGERAQLVVDRPALDTCDEHYSCASRTAGSLGQERQRDSRTRARSRVGDTQSTGCAK